MVRGALQASVLCLAACARDAEERCAIGIPATSIDGEVYPAPFDPSVMTRFGPP